MRFEIKDIGEDGEDVQVPVTPAWLLAECPGLEAQPDGLELRGRLCRTGDDFLLTGRLAGALVGTCARCLEPARVELAADVAVTYVEKVAARRHDDEDDSGALPDGGEVLAFEDGVIDLSGELRDEILLAFPPAPHCKEDCLGLCPVCGGNRNENPCDCAERQRAATSKFAALGKLKADIEN
jgi:uncharacterized protein